MHLKKTSLLLLTFIFASCAAYGPSATTRIEIAAPDGVFKLFRTPEGLLSQQEIRKTSRRTIVTSVDTRKHLITIKRPDGKPLTVSSSAANFPLSRLQPDVPILARAYISSIFSVVSEDDVELSNPQRATALTQAAKNGLTNNYVVTSVENTFVTVEEVFPELGEVALKRPDSSILRFPVRYPENFERIDVGDMIALTRLTALSLHLIPNT